MVIAIALHSTLVLVLAATVQAGPDCYDAGNECFGKGETCAVLTLCPDHGNCGNPLVRSWCLGQWMDTPGNIFDSNGHWGDQQFSYMRFDVQPAKDAGNSYVSLFEADYCTGWPVSVNGDDSGAGAYLPGEYWFDAVTVKCIHPYFWPERDTLPGVGIKLVLWPDNDEAPYDQITCLPDDWVDAGMSGWFGQGCASGVDGIYCIQPDSWGANDGILDRLDFAGSTSGSGNNVVQSYQDYGSYPVGSVMVNTFYSVAGDRGYCDQTLPYGHDSPGFCDVGSPYSGYCVFTRFSNVAGNGDWDAFDAQAVADHASVCSGWGAVWGSLAGLTRPDASSYDDWPLPIKYAWTRILPCGGWSAASNSADNLTMESSLRGSKR